MGIRTKINKCREIFQETCDLETTIYSLQDTLNFMAVQGMWSQERERLGDYSTTQEYYRIRDIRDSVFKRMSALRRPVKGVVAALFHYRAEERMGKQTDELRERYRALREYLAPYEQARQDYKETPPSTTFVAACLDLIQFLK
jgi:hypothetical protein